MSNFEKMNIYVPENVGLILENDIKAFEIYKDDMCKYNPNNFICRIIAGYYNQYNDEIFNKKKRIEQFLYDNGFEKNVILKITDGLMNVTHYPEIPSRKGKNPKTISLKPTNSIESIMLNIFKNETSPPQYICELLASYSIKPFYERERIVFYDNYSFLDKACKKNRPVMFTTIWNKGFLHTVVPYKLIYSKDEMYNYLLCEELNPITQKQETASYHLNRIRNLSFSNSLMRLSEKNTRFFDAMIKYGPQFAINEENHVIVRLSEKGKESFSKIFYGRPEPVGVTPFEEKYDYHFECSENQVFLYFRRFEKDQAEIIKPISLRTKMASFHKEALQKYE